VEYFITINGKERRKKLNIDYLNASQKLYNSAKENIEEFLAQIESRGFKKILLYGAGEVAEILLQTIVTNKNSQVDVLAVIDDDINKQGKERNQRIFFINVVDNSVLFFNINRYSQCFLCSRNFYFAYVFFMY
jgi:FlaA1/EpsC-like NDP-sugar epimerase